MTGSMLLATIIVYIILLAILYLEICAEHLSTVMWDSRNSYMDLMEKFGLPTVINFERGGGAIWNIDFNGVRQQIVLFDQKLGVEPEPCIHITTPITLFAGINPQTVKVSGQGIRRRIGDIIGILPKYISYDSVRHTVTTRFYNLQFCYFMTMLCMKVTTGELSKSNAQSKLLLLSKDFSHSASNEAEAYIAEYCTTA